MCVRRYLLTYLFAPWCRVLLQKLTGLQLVKKFHAFHGTRRFITALTSVRHLSLSWASPIQVIYPHPTYWRSILIFYTHLCLGSPVVSFPPVSPARPIHSLSSPMRATCPAHLILLDFITRTNWVRSTNHLAHSHAVSSIPALPEKWFMKIVLYLCLYVKPFSHRIFTDGSCVLESVLSEGLRSNIVR